MHCVLFPVIISVFLLRIWQGLFYKNSQSIVSKMKVNRPLTKFAPGYKILLSNNQYYINKLLMKMSLVKWSIQFRKQEKKSIQ